MAAAKPGRVRTAPRATTTLAAQPWPALFAATLALYVAVVVGRVHEAVPFVARLYLGKTSALALIAAAVFQLRGRDFSLLFKTSTARALMVITGIGLISVPFSYWPSQSLGFFENQWPQTILMFACVAVGFTNRRTALLCIIALVATASLGAIQLNLGGGPDIGGRVFIGNGLSQTYDPNQSAAFFVMVLPYVVVLASRKGVLRWFAIPLIPVFVSALLKTDSRGGTVALGALAVAFLFVANKRQRKAFLVLFPLVAMTLVLMPHSSIMERFSELTGGSDYNLTSRDGRWPIWQHGFSLMLTHPIGVGIGAYEAANAVTSGSWKTAHNAYIQIGVELGVGGLIAFFVAIRGAFRSGWKVRAATAPGASNDDDELRPFDRLLATAALCSLVGELTAAIFLSMAYDAMTLFTFAVPTGLALTVVGTEVNKRVVARAPSGRAAGWRSARRPAPQPSQPVHATSAARARV